VTRQEIEDAERKKRDLASSRLLDDSARFCDLIAEK
jgi:hypothetical protein